MSVAIPQVDLARLRKTGIRPKFPLVSLIGVH